MARLCLVLVCGADSCEESDGRCRECNLDEERPHAECSDEGEPEDSGWVVRQHQQSRHNNKQNRLLMHCNGGGRAQQQSAIPTRAMVGEERKINTSAS